VVGDRLDTDVLGANRAGAHSLLVMTGVTDLPELLAAPAELRPTYVGWDLRALGAAQPPVALAGGVARCGAARAWRERGEVRSDGPPDAALRASCALAWSSTG
jgi:hypothetical protein